MTRVSVSEVLGQRALVTREAARRLLDRVAALPESLDDTMLELDFQGIEALSPSFLDELIGACVEWAHSRPATVRLLAPPERLLERFRAIAVGRGVSVTSDIIGWQLNLAAPSTA